MGIVGALRHLLSFRGRTRRRGTRSTISQNPYRVRDVATMVPKTMKAQGRWCSLREMRKLLSSSYIMIGIAQVRLPNILGTDGPA